VTVLSALSRESGAVLQGLWLFLAVFATRGIFLFVLVYCVNKSFPWLPASFCHALWFVVICGFVVLPAARLLLPVVTLEAERAHSAGQAYGLLLAPLAYRQSLESVIVESGPVISASTGSGARYLASVAVTIVYLGGVVFCLIRFFAARIALRDLIASARTPLRCGQLVNRLTRQLAIRRRVSVLVHDSISIPFACGFLRPRVILPAGSRSWSWMRIRAVLTHELAHIKRGDCLFNMVSELMCAGLWFLPPVWIARSFMRQEAEMSCDHSVLDRGFRGTEYASVILQVAAAGRGGFLPAQSFLGSRRTLKERIQRILRSGPGARSGAGVRSRKVLSTAAGIALAFFALTISLKETQKLFGTWVNFGIAGPAKYAWSEEGIGRQFARSYASNDSGIGREFGKSLKNLPCSQGRFVIEKEWTDSKGDAWYQLKATWSSAGCARYALIRLEASGNTYESDESYLGYPTEFAGPIGAGMHQMFVRQ
jgi:beta-lactamase regulating signal transducer with metallopeptidase domain